MSNAMTDEELQSWRAKRTGKSSPMSSTPIEPNKSGGGPEAPRHTRNPMTGFAAPADDDNDDDDNINGGSDDNNGDLHSQLNSAIGRTAPLQRQNEELRTALEATQRQMYDMQERLKAQEREQSEARARQEAENFNPLEGMSQDEIDMLDPIATELIKKAARAAYSKAASGIKDPEKLIEQALAQRDQRARDNYMRATVKTLGIDKLSNDTKFLNFLEEDDAAKFLLNAFAQSPDMDSARGLEGNLRKLVKRFEKSTGSTRGADPADRLSSHLSRTPNGNRDYGNVQSVSSPEEARQVRNQATRLIRARKFDEANRLMASLNL